jgi:3-hydroxyacyl-CoA dehydrogenase / enoyl-CoA hydratase / 3-hydroxybutyryl-CoA epimerase
VSLDLLRQVRGRETDAVDEVLRIMIEQCGRHGKKTRQGFYEYPPAGRKRLWPDLARWFPLRTDQPAAGELILRFRWVQSLETVRCIEEGVVQDRRDADIGSVLGWSFCPALGGTIGHIETVGIGPFIAESERLEKAYGERFAPPDLLRKMQFGG